MKIGIVSIAYNPGGWTTKQIESILPNTKHEILFDLHLHNNRYSELIEECETISQKYPINYYAHGKNRGLAISGNDSIERLLEIEQCDIFISISQDIYFNNADSFDRWMNDCSAYLDTKYIIGHIATFQNNYPVDSAPFSMTIRTRHGFDKIGYDDENFFPATHADLDNHKRCSLSNNEDPNNNFWNSQYRIDIKADTTHYCSLRKIDLELLYQEEYITGPAVRSYYLKKWGNDTYSYPFNKKEFGYYISRGARHHPYGTEYDRSDQNIVKI